MKADHRRKVIIMSVFVFEILASHLYAVGGKVAGRVYDANSNEPLPGANVFIEGTTMGAAADMNGDYFILNVPPGTYTVVASVIGYEGIRMTNVVVQAGLTTTVGFGLNPSPIEGQEVTVTAERKVIQTDVGNSRTMLDGSEVAAIPVTSFKEVLDKQIGIREMDARGLFMRGQRQNSMSLTVDGIETRDVVDNQIYMRFNPDELEEVEISAGGYEASKGNATAGIVSLATKEGGKSYFGTFDYRRTIPDKKLDYRKHFGPSLKEYFDDYFLTRWDTTMVYAAWKPYLTGNPDDTLATIWESKSHLGILPPFRDRPNLMKELYKYRLRDEVTRYGDKPDFVLSSTFGGPVPFLDHTTFFSSYRRETNYYLYNGPADHFFDQNAMFKVTAHPTNSTKLSVNFRYIESSGLSRYDYYLYDRDNDLGRVDPDFQINKSLIYEGVEQVAWTGFGCWPYTSFMGISTRYTNQYGVTFTHSVSPRTYYVVKLMANNFRTRGRMPAARDTSATYLLIADPYELYIPTLGSEPDTAILIGEYALAPVGHQPEGGKDPGIGEDIPISGTYGYSERNYARDFAIRADWYSQANKYNYINAGFQYGYYDFKKSEDRVQGTFRDDDWKWHVYPQAAAFWLSDKIEFKGLVINAGLRSDIRIPDETLDWVNHPWDTTRADFYNKPEDLPDSLWHGIMEINKSGPTYKPPIKMVLAPRFSIAHAIGEFAKIYFNWGHFYQEQAYERQYMYYLRGGPNQGGTGLTTYGNPELPFEKTVQYEVGYEHNVRNIFRIGLSGYSKDVTNLLKDRIRYRGDEEVHGDWRARFFTFGANRYLSVQGFEGRLEKRIGRFWTGWINYSYESFSRGVYGFDYFYEDPDKEPTKSSNFQDQNIERPPESRINAGVNLYTPKGYGPQLLGLFPVANIHLDFLFNWRQQPAFTYSKDSQGKDPLYLERNNWRWKSHWSVNMSFRKRFNLRGPVKPVFYVEVYNLFNTKNMFRGSFHSDRGDVFERYMDAIIEAGAKPGERGDLAREAIGNLPGNILHNPVPAYVPFALYLNPRQVWLGIRFELL